MIADTTEPSVKITNPSGGEYINTTTVTIEWTVSDNFGLDHCEIRIDGGEWIDIRNVTNYTITGLSEGSHIIEVRVYDVAGNIGEDSIMITIDITAPMITGVHPSEQFYINTTNVTLSWEAIDNYGIDRYYIRIGNDSWIDVGQKNEYFIEGLSEGINIIYIKAVDKAGNSDIVEVRVIVDMAPPELMIYVAFNNSYVNTETVMFAWNMSDDWEIDHVEVSINGGSWVNIGVSYSYILTNLSETRYIVTICVFDRAGNSASATIVFTVDYTNPIFVEVSPESGTFLNTTNITISWNATDNYDIAYFEIRIDGGEWVAIDGARNYSVYLEDGMHIVDITAYDRAGNKAQTSVIIYVDTSPPIIHIDMPRDEEYIAIPNITIKWHATDNFGIDRYEVRLDNGSWVPLTTTYYRFEGLFDGTHTVYVRAYDYAGNMVTAEVTFVIDTTPPTIKIIEPKNGSELTNKTVTVSWNVIDNIGLDHIEISIDGKEYQNIGLATSITMDLDYGEHTLSLIHI